MLLLMFLICGECGKRKTPLQRKKPRQEPGSLGGPILLREGRPAVAPGLASAGCGLYPFSAGCGLYPASAGCGLHPSSAGRHLHPASVGRGLHPSFAGCGLYLSSAPLGCLFQVLVQPGINYIGVKTYSYKHSGCISILPGTTSQL